MSMTAKERTSLCCNIRAALLILEIDPDTKMTPENVDRLEDKFGEIDRNIIVGFVNTPTLMKYLNELSDNDLLLFNNTVKSLLPPFGNDFLLCRAAFYELDYKTVGDMLYRAFPDDKPSMLIDAMFRKNPEEFVEILQISNFEDLLNHDRGLVNTMLVGISLRLEELLVNKAIGDMECKLFMFTYELGHWEKQTHRG